MSGNGYGCCDSVQAPLTLITAFGRLQVPSTFGGRPRAAAARGAARAGPS